MNAWDDARGVCRCCCEYATDLDATGLCPQCREEIAELLEGTEDPPPSGSEYLRSVTAAEEQGWR